jgi:hypothetical protein
LSFVLFLINPIFANCFEPAPTKVEFGKQGRDRDKIRAKGFIEKIK